VITIESRFFKNARTAYWTLMINYRPLDITPPVQQLPRKVRDQLRASLTDDQWTIFERLREWRHALANSRGIPPFIIFNDQHLIDLVKIRPASLHQMQRIKGIGTKSVAKYGEAVLRILGFTVEHKDAGSAPEDDPPAATEKKE